VGKLGIGLADSCLLQENTVDINQLEHIYWNIHSYPVIKSQIFYFITNIVHGDRISNFEEKYNISLIINTHKLHLKGTRQALESTQCTWCSFKTCIYNYCSGKALVTKTKYGFN
jgi:hypothetical protein